MKHLFSEEVTHMLNGYNSDWAKHIYKHGNPKKILTRDDVESFKYIGTWGSVSNWEQEVIRVFKQLGIHNKTIYLGGE